MRYLLDLIWPMPQRPSKQELDNLDTETQRDLDKLRAADWLTSNVDILDEARRLADKELARKGTADTKAGIYLAAVFALAPIVATISASAWEPRGTLAKSTILVIVSLLAVLYVAMAGVWAFRALSVIPLHRVDAVDLANICETKFLVRASLVREILISVRLNRNGVNKAVSCVKMAQEFLFRTIILIGFIIIINLLWGPFEYLIKRIVMTGVVPGISGEIYFGI